MDLGWKITLRRGRVVKETVDGFSALTGGGRVSGLDHKVALDIVEAAKVIVFDLAELEEVEAGCGRFLGVEVNDDVANGCLDQDTHSEKGRLKVSWSTLA